MDHSIENSFNKKYLAGFDEAGRGPLAGPVVAAAFMFKHNSNVPSLLNDSKKLSKSTREKLFIQITQHHFFGIGISSVAEIDQLNILEATKLAMRRAEQNLKQRIDLALIDGNFKANLIAPEISIIKGDQKCPSIAAASIIAKVTRDKILTDLAKNYPQYEWHNNFGYGTKKHINSIHNYGPTIHHRQTFAPIKNMLDKHII